MQYSALLYTLLFLATPFGRKFRVGATTPESVMQHEIYSGCILPIQPIGVSFILNSCTGSSCNILPWTRVPGGSILKYTCSEGYVLKGGDISFCDFKGHWVLTPTCVKSCPALRLQGVEAVCDYHGENVSCESTTEPGTKASLACKEFHKMTLGDHSADREITCLGNGVWSHTAFRCIPECGTAMAYGHDMNVNGFTVKHSGFPWHVVIYEKESSGNFVQICMGTLVSLDLAISASHCFYDEIVSKPMNSSKFSVAAGKFYRSYDTSEYFAQTSTVKRISITRKYLGSIRNYAEDIAVLRLETPFTLSKLVKPICMDWYNTLEKKDINRERSGKTVWWGKTTNESIGGQLEEIDLPYISFRNCLATVPDDFKSFLTTDKFCAGYLNGTRPCEAESGGGLYFQFDGRWFLRGIISVGPVDNGTCDKNSYTVLTKVGHFLEWIRHDYLSIGNTAPMELPDGLTTDEPVQDLNTENSTSGCTLPEQPTGGSFDLDLCGDAGGRVSIGSVLIYRCNEGYALKGHRVSVCYGNVWNPPTTCIKTCPKLESKSVDIVCKYKNVIVSCEDAILPATKATLACKNLYEIPLADDPAYREITCLEEGVWDRSVFHCFPECGMSEAHGNPLKINGSSYPWHVDIYKKISIGNFEQICAGTLVSPDLVVSAAHCFYNETTSEVMNASYFTVAAGKHYRSSNVTEPYAQNSPVKQIDLAERYIGTIGKHAQDIALLRLEVPFNMTMSVRLICIDWNNKYESEQLEQGKSGKALRRGTVISGVFGTEIEEVNYPYVPDHECFFAVQKRFTSFVTADKFCAGYLNGSSLCTRDGGGGLYFQSDGLWYLRGIISVQPALTDGTCDSNYYGIFTNVGNFVEWIRSAYLSTGSADRPDSCRKLIGTSESNRNGTGGHGSSTSPTSGCILPEQPTGGSFELGSCKGQCDVSPGTRVPMGSFLIYRCDQDYTVNGNNVTVCHNNEWYRPPTCVSKFCPALSLKGVNFDCKLHGKIVSCESAILPYTRATLACKNFYQFLVVVDPDPKEFTCLEDGSWDRTDFNCDSYECGIHESEVNPGRFPWHVYIYNSTSPYCSGTLISPNLVISAASCLTSSSAVEVNANDYVVTAGKDHFPSPYDTQESHAQASLVSRIIITERYRGYGERYANNIALLYLQVPFEITTFVRPICIDKDSNHRIEKEMSEGGRAKKVVVWWHSRSKVPSNESYSTTLPYLSYEECFSRVDEPNKRYVANDTFCTEATKDSFGIRSYSDIFMVAVGYETQSLWYLLGLKRVRIDPENDEQPSVYVFEKLGGHLDWIRATYVGA